MIQRWWLPTRKQCIQTHWSSCTHRTHKDFDSRDMICRRQSQKKKKQLGNGVLRENCLHSVNHVATITVSSFVHLSFCVLWTLFPWIQQSWVNVFPFWICWPVRSHQLLKKISGSSQYCWLYPRAQEKDFFAEVTLRLVTEHGNFRTVLAWKCHPYRLPFSTRNYLRGEKCSTILSICEPCEISNIWTSKTISSIQ